MAFPKDVIGQAWERSGGQCECTKRTHRHFYTPCGKSLKRNMRGEIGEGSWEARYVNTLDGDTVANCEILCTECNEAL